MKIVFSRKGFDSSSGGGPSPIIDGRTRSLPIPERVPSPRRYSDLGLGELAHTASRTEVKPDAWCHEDPMFHDGWCWFGQCGPAQSHLVNQGVGPGDVFLFFGLYADPQDGHLHHRIFGYLRVAVLGLVSEVESCPRWREPPHPHPHFHIDYGHKNNSIWFGTGATHAPAVEGLRLTAPGTTDRPSLWQWPDWMQAGSLSYHTAKKRWLPSNRLQTVGRGQEFVCDIGDREEPRRWLAERIAEIESG